jgi:hypothetical protein
MHTAIVAVQTVAGLFGGVLDAMTGLIAEY